MQISFSIILLFLASTLLDYIELAYYWQLKEYRFDRFRDFLDTALGKKFFCSYKIVTRPVLYLILILLFPITTILVVIFILDIFTSLIKIIRHIFYRPKFTTKALLIIFISVCFEAILLLSGNAFIWLLAASRFLIISLAVFGANLISNAAKKYYYKKAAKKLSSLKKLTVIGVTGSYGKTTVKNFLEQMLSAKFKVIKTPKNINTEMGVAKFILKNNFSQTDIFIVEMAAYKIGEIQLICDIVKPKIGVLTTINEQHLSLFGGIKNTQAAKYELLKSLPEDGLAIVNSDNEYCREFIPDLKCRVKTFGHLEKFNPNLLISEVSREPSKLHFKAGGYEIKTDLIGAHNAMNIAPVILAAADLGFSKTEIEKQSAELSLPEATMEIVEYGKSLVIDDSYNSNPEAFNVALKFLAASKTNGKKIVISRGMIELGEASKAAHEKVGRHIAEVADEFIIISPDSVDDLKTGIADAKLEVKTIFNPTELLNYLKQNKEENNLILLEGRVPEIIKKEIKR